MLLSLFINKPEVLRLSDHKASFKSANNANIFQIREHYFNLNTFISVDLGLYYC